jgi:hypothetical protein
VFDVQGGILRQIRKDITRFSLLRRGDARNI